MRAAIIRCICGLKVRAMAASGHVVTRLDRELWRKGCREADRARSLIECRRFQEARKRALAD